MYLYSYAHLNLCRCVSPSRILCILLKMEAQMEEKNRQILTESRMGNDSIQHFNMRIFQDEIFMRGG